MVLHVAVAATAGMLPAGGHRRLAVSNMVSTDTTVRKRSCLPICGRRLVHLYLHVPHAVFVPVRPNVRHTRTCG